jgi:hypothetical protein
MDPATAAYAAATAHDRDYGSLMDPRLNPHRDMMDPRHHMEDLRAHQGQFGGGNGGYGDHTVGGNGNIKTSSAFSPIQGSMLQASAAAQGFMGGSRGYSFYDPIGFPKHHSQVLYWIDIVSARVIAWAHSQQLERTRNNFERTRNSLSALETTLSARATAALNALETALNALATFLSARATAWAHSNQLWAHAQQLTIETIMDF